MAPDIDKLVYSAHAPDYGPVADRHVTGYLTIITHNAVISHNTVVGKMAIGHDQAVLADHRFFPVLGTPVNGYKFPDRSTITDIYIGIFALEFQVLRYGCNNRPRKDPAILANPRSFHDRNIGANPGTITHFHILVNNGKGVHFYVCSQLCIRVNVCMRVNHEVVLRKTPRRGERRCAKVIVTGKNRIFFGLVC